MRQAAQARLLGSLLLLGASNAFGLGLGRVSTLSHLGNPLELSVGVSAEIDDGLTPDCVNAEVFVGDHRLANELVRIRINRAPDGTPISLRLVTGARIDEPVATVTLMLGCPTRVTRRYVVFIDPPSVNLAQSGSAAESTASAEVQPPIAAAPPRPQTARPRPPAAVVAAAGETAPRPIDAGVPTTQPRPVDPTDARTAAPAARSRRSAAPEAAPTAQTSPRLRLESAPPVTAASPAREQSADAKRDAAAPAISASGIADLTAQVAANSLALDQERLRALEERFNRLRTDSDATKRSLAEIEARLKAAQSDRYEKTVVYGLAAAVVLLLSALIVLLMRLRSDRARATWAQRDAEADEAVDSASAAHPEPSNEEAPRVPAVRIGDDLHPDPAVEHKDAWNVDAASDAVEDDERPETVDADHGARGEHTLDQPQTMPGAAYGMGGAGAAAARHGSIDELMDLEQQADFFVVLGQDDAAIELLTAHVQTTGDASPVPYLKLLEIYRRRGDQPAYTRTRERFNRRFGATAPNWEDEPRVGRSIEEHPQVIERLQRVWSDPAKAMDLLESLLFRRDPSVPEFDLPAYGELLFLYTISRDLAERQAANDEVDVLLPLGDEAPAPRSLGFDLSLDSPSEERGRTEPVALDFNLNLLDKPIVPRSIAASNEAEALPPPAPVER